MTKGRHPIAVLDLRVHAAPVDGDVPPTKSEVKFRDSSQVLSVIGRAVRDALVEAGVRPWADPSSPMPGDVAQRRFELRRLGDRWEREVGGQGIGDGEQGTG